MKWSSHCMHPLSGYPISCPRCGAYLHGQRQATQEDYKKARSIARKRRKVRIKDMCSTILDVGLAISPLVLSGILSFLLYFVKCSPMLLIFVLIGFTFVCIGYLVSKNPQGRVPRALPVGE